MNRIINILIACLLHATLSVASAYNLRVEVTPGGAGTLNTSSGTYEQGASIYLRTYNNTGYQFKGWFDGETLLSSSTSFYYTMPAHDALVQARYEYDPTVPGNPAMPDTTKYYTFSASVSPVGAGTLNIYSGKYAAYANISMQAYVNSGYHFAGWRDENGDTLSKSTSYKYKMPQKDAHLTALYYYDPDVPANPNPMGISRRVTVECKPVGGGTFNISNTKAEAGSSMRLYSYTNTGYKFLHWENEEGETIATGQNFYYTVPDKDSKIYGVFEYDPAVPGNPNKNYWNKDFGEVIVDDFNAGSLSSAISTAISGSSSSDVAMITVAGRMNSNDFGIANNYSGCTLLDLSRVTGITEVPSYAFDYTGLESVYLPSTIEKIGYRAFYDCTRLSSLTIYSMTPPALENYVFDGVPEGLIIYVPAAVIAQYQEADGWKDFTFLPIQEDIRSLTVNLPAETTASDYKQMWLELTNVKSGQRLHYILTDRTVYTYPNLIRNTTWNVQLRNEAGDIFGRIENVEVKDEDVTVTFASLQKPQTVSLKVLTPDGSDITSQVQITWTDANGKYLSQQTSISGLIEGKQLNYKIALQQNAAMQYNAPTATEYVVKSADNDVVYTLTNIPQLTIEGKVTNTASGQPVKEATVSASQTFAGIYSKVTNVRTAADGTYKLQLLNTPTVVSISAKDYISQSIVCDTLIAGADKVELPETKLKGISGAILNINFTYTESAEEGTEAETINWYNDYNNVAYTIYNKTKGRVVNQFNVQYPQIVLLEEVDEDDQLQVTATSLNAAFKAVECCAAIADQKADFTFDILELGEISANFKKTTNATVAAILYDAAGKLIKSYNYDNATLTISNLADGEYTLVSMGGSRILNTIYDLSKFAEAGLTLGSDYVQQSIEVKSGAVSKITFDEIPLLDESKFYYTGSGTSFTVNKTSIVSGNYLTLTGKIDFKQEYAGKVSNVSLVVDLPTECSFVENSVMVGNSTSSYVLDGNRLTIPMARYTDRVRFCVIPTKGGEYAPGAFVCFDINGESINQPIGAAYYTAKDLSISVPSTVARTSVPISGSAIGTSSVEIYDNGVLIGQTTSLANGTWETICELNNPYNLSMHTIYAKIKTKTGMELLSEAQEVRYDINNVVPEKVTMLYYNPEYVGQYNIVFDLINATVTPNSYYFFPYKSFPNWHGSGTEPKEFTFIVDFTNNSPEIVSDVVIYVYTDNNNIIPLTAEYDEISNSWTAVSEFSEGNLPINVSVDYLKANSMVVDNKEHLNSQIEEIKGWQNAIYNYANEHLEFELIEDNENSCTYKITGEGIEQAQLWTITQLDYNIAKQMLREKSFEHISSENGNGYTCRYLEQKDDAIILYTIDTEQQLAFEIKFTLPTSNTVIKKAITIIHWNRVSQTLKSAVRELRMHYTNPKELISDGVEIGGSALDFLGINKYIGAKDFNLCFDVMETYIDGFIAHQEQILKLITQQCKDGSYRLSASQREKYFKELSNMNNLIGLFMSTFESYVELYQMKLKSALWVDFLTMGAGKVIGNIAKAGIILRNSKNARYFEYIISDKYHREWLGSGLEIAFSEAVEGLDRFINPDFTKFEEVESDMYQWMNEERSKYNKMYSSMKSRIKADYKKCTPQPEPTPTNPPTPPTPPTTPIHDPSGYVYEGVSSNRVQGATATVYYKEMVEDMYGDLHENIVKWNAEEYAQENPLFTDENGMYRWDVPQGLWQVKFEKEGYETTYSEWLPVPPPQLEVNIAMKQNIQPNVETARAFEDAIEIKFDKYMQPELLNTENIVVTADGNVVEGSIELLDEEVSYEGLSDKYASRIRFNASEPFPTKEVTLMVKNRVKSYAGVRMQDDYSQSFTVELEVRKIECDSAITVIYGEENSMMVKVLPAAAAAGKTLNVKALSSMLFTVDATSTELDENGCAEITMNGELPGTSALRFDIDGYDISASTIVNVKMREAVVTATPTASIASGAEIEKGTKLYLHCETEDATIYYTLDGSCPCDESDAVKVYDGNPIILTESVTIKAMATAKDMMESDVAEFMYTVNNLYLRGDADNSGNVDLLDINATLNYILGEGDNNLNLMQMDSNGDGNIDLLDINTTLEIILTGDDKSPINSRKKRIIVIPNTPVL